MGPSTAPADERRVERAWLAGILGLALVLRLVMLVVAGNIHFPDEVFQTVEQAHRLVFGYGVVPWEFRDGIRSWVLPAALAVPMWAGSLVADDPTVYMLVVGASLVALSLLTVGGAFYLGRRIGLAHAIVAGFVAAIWFELVYHAGRSLTEVVATAPLVLGLLLATRPRLDRRALVLTGLLLGASVALRVHLAPGVAVAGLWLLWRHGRHAALPLIGGGLVPLLVVGVVDAWTWGMPFASFVRNFNANIVNGVAATFGESPFYDYLITTARMWRHVGPVIVVLALLGGRRFPVWLLTAVAIVAVHSLIGHKEQRFIFPATTLFVILAAIGSADVLAWVRRRLPGPRTVRLALPVTLAAWTVATAFLWTSPNQAARWDSQRSMLSAFQWLNEQPDLCGLALDLNGPFVTAGYTHLHRDVPLRLRPLDAGPETYNHVIHRTADTPPPAGAYTLAACFVDSNGELCVYRRPGTCQPASGVPSAATS